MLYREKGARERISEAKNGEWFEDHRGRRVDGSDGYHTVMMQSVADSTVGRSMKERKRRWR